MPTQNNLLPETERLFAVNEMEKWRTDGRYKAITLSNWRNHAKAVIRDYFPDHDAYINAYNLINILKRTVIVDEMTREEYDNNYNYWALFFDDYVQKNGTFSEKNP